MHNNKYGTLYIVATPIGNLEDITIRALNILRAVNYIAAEDTRHSNILLKHFAINRPLISLHNFNEKQQSTNLIKLLQHGNNIALISDAGTPLISDPGYRLISFVQQADINITPIPGACAAITALCASCLPTDKFIFEGFLPAKAGARNQRLQDLKNETRTMIYYEAPHRILSTINTMLDIFGKDRRAVIARELTKKFETIYRDNLSGIKTWFETDINQQKGEVVILVHGSESSNSQEINADTLNLLTILAKELPPNQATNLASQITGVRKNLLYKFMKNL
jgi:16S rRNA (cytidine1402-2'-O)-methyltransferase